MARTSSPTGLTHLRITLSDEFYVGPGRADLLELIAETGSISAAGKRMGMSYKRAWSLVQAMNEGWGGLLVEASRGGSGQGAVLTADGEIVLARYRAMQAAAHSAVAADVSALKRRMSDISGRK